MLKDAASHHDTQILSNTSVSHRTAGLPCCVRALACVRARTCLSHIDFSHSHLFFTNLGINTCHWKTREHCTCGTRFYAVLSVYRLVNSDVSKALRFLKCRELLAQRHYIQSQNTSLRNF